jgi:hypothetical protein
MIITGGDLCPSIAARQARPQPRRSGPHPPTRHQPTPLAHVDPCCRLGYGQSVSGLIDCNVHLWDQTTNPIFWLSDRTLVREMIGDYDSLPDT